MTKRRRIRQRDSEATRRKLLDAVSAIMREHGFAGLRTGMIARFVGKDKNLIRYHFSGLAGLQKAYIREKDYWPPFFERFAISDGSSAFEIEQLFSELMQENLRFFYSDVEMQKIILWQISEKNALMRSISDAREADGAKLLDLTDRFFLGTDVNFRVVIALLLGGVYYMVLHANGNGSVVCGIDVHAERDRTDVLRTIGQVVGWAFRQVEDGTDRADGLRDEVSLNGAGKGIFSGLEKLASRFGRFVSGGRGDIGYVRALETEVSRVGSLLDKRLLEISGPAQLSSFVRVSMFRLGSLADRFYMDAGDGHREAELVASLLEVFVGGFSELVPRELVMPRIVWERELGVLGRSMANLERLIDALGIHELLAKVIKAPLVRFFEGRGTASFGELFALKVYFAEISERLQGMNVSEQDLFLYQVGLDEDGTGLLDYLRARVALLSSGGSELEVRRVLLELRKGISAVRVSGEGKVRAELLDWIDQQLAGTLGGAEHRFSSGLKVVELAYLLKLLYDRDVFGGVKLDVFCRQVGANFLSSSGSEISASSIKSKLYPKDPVVKGAVVKLLVSMLEDLRSEN